jgi:4-hydroxy-tetrahydrodipicolinate synthase
MFSGSLVALITPFSNGNVDVQTLRSIVEWQIAEGIDGIVPCGTTGECATLSDDEWALVVRTVIEQVNGRVPVIAGTGTNSTVTTIARTRHARELGASGAMLVTPYYNKPSQDGLFRHYSAVAEAVDLPLVPYNVPSRTGVNLLPETAIRLAQIPNIVAIKEASGSPDQSSQIIVGAGEHIDILCGDDSLTVPILSLGGVGVVSVLANIVPGPVSRMVREFRSGNQRAAQLIHCELFDLARAMFIETNPVPVKTAAHLLGLCSDEVRLPLSPMSDHNRNRLISELEVSPWTTRAIEMNAAQSGIHDAATNSSL